MQYYFNLSDSYKDIVRGSFFFNLRWTIEKKTRVKNKMNLLPKVMYIYGYLITVKIQAYVISVDELSDPLFEEHCCQ